MNDVLTDSQLGKKYSVRYGLLAEHKLRQSTVLCDVSIHRCPTHDGVWTEDATIVILELEM